MEGLAGGWREGDRVRALVAFAPYNVSVGDEGTVQGPSIDPRIADAHERVCVDMGEGKGRVNFKGATQLEGAQETEEELDDLSVSHEEQEQIAAAIDASLRLSEGPPGFPLASEPASSRVKRWGDGLDAPAAGVRHFYPPGFEVTLEVSEAISWFGHSAAQVSQIMETGRAKAATSAAPLAAVHAAALFAYTQEEPASLYSTLNYAMRTPHTSDTPTDTELRRYADYIMHTERALGSLPTHVSERPEHGMVYRGIRALLNPEIYAPGRRITWQGFSSSTKKQLATLEFLSVLPGRKLQGSLFVISSITAKDIRHFSAFPGEEEVLFPPNSQFKVDKVLRKEEGKKMVLNQLAAYDMTELDVYVLKQTA